MNNHKEWDKGFIAGLRSAKTELLAVVQKLEDYAKQKEDRLNESS